jgi:hypothetical protein
MAIAFRAAGARLKADITTAGSPQNVGLPAGHVANDVLLLIVLTDDNASPSSTPSGWTRLIVQSAAGSLGTPYTPRPHLTVYGRVDTGALGSNVSVSFNQLAYPVGNPYVVACTLAYSGCDTSSPFGELNSSATTSTTAAQAHPQLTTTLANDWLVTIRGASCDTSAATFTESVGTDVERVDDSDGLGELSIGLYDSNTALSAGLQTQRTTTASRTVTYGSVMASIALRPSPAAGATVAAPGTAEGAGTAYDATVTAVSGPWSCAADLPAYTFAIDWDGDGSLDTAGARLTANPYFLTDTTGWTASGSTIVRSSDLKDTTGLWTLKVTPDGVSVSGGATYSPHTAAGSVTAGQAYTAQCWAYSPAGWTDLRATVDWYDSSDVFISTTLGSATSVAAGTWTLLSQSLTAPALASRASVRFRFGGTPPATNITYVWGLLLVNPVASGTFMNPAPGEFTTPDILGGGVTIDYGRDQARQLSPTKVGSSGFSVNNATRKYSPEYATSPLFGDLDPAREMKGEVSFQGAVYPLSFARVDDYNIHADRDNRTVDFTFLDGLKLLDGFPLSTGIVQTMRTGELIDYVLDLAGWTGGRDIDPGATVVPYWWVEGASALSAVQDLVKSEGPPSVAYVDLNNTFVFRDRHHRLLRSASVNVQASFASKKLGDCASPAVTGLSYTAPSDYAHGWRDIYNSVSFDVDERSPDTDYTAVWSSDSTISLAIGESMEIDISGGDPFLDAQTPVSGTDFTLSGAGTVSVTLSRTSGQSARVTLLAIGGSVVITGLQVRARALPVRRTTKISRQDTGSISSHGERSYPETAPWATAGDAYAIASMILLHYSKRRPTVQLRLVASDPEHFGQIVNRTISDRIHLINDELGLASDFFIETVSHQIDRMNKTDLPPVHSVIFGCEKDLALVANPFRFDVRGAGFDQGVFDPITSDVPGSVFIFDDSAQGQFDTGLFGT